MEDLDLEADNPHGEDIEPVDCGGCHEDEAEIYVKHGRLEVGDDPDLPECWDCHGSHDILPSSDRQAHTHPINLPSTCRSCHSDVDLVKKHDILRDKPIELYQSSVHGQASQKGLYVAATCNDCHSADSAAGEKTAHRILSPADPESTIFHFNIPNTCGHCHESVAMDYVEGIHGQLVARGEVDAPVCTHCHGEHGIISPSDPRSPVSAGRIAEATCAPCHESEVLNQKYGIPAGRLRSYIDSYHGLKSKAGDVRVANCASCHGAHRILPHTDPTSSIYADNLQAYLRRMPSRHLRGAGLRADPRDRHRNQDRLAAVLHDSVHVHHRHHHRRDVPAQPRRLVPPPAEHAERALCHPLDCQ